MLIDTKPGEMTKRCKQRYRIEGMNMETQRVDQEVPREGLGKVR